MSKSKLHIKKGSGRKKMLNVLNEYDELSQYRDFIWSIWEYCSVANRSYEIMSGDYMGTLHLIRLLCDGIYCIYGLILADNKDKYLDSFFNNEPINKLKRGNELLTTNTISKYISEQYKGLDAIYKESCRYLHPSIFMRIIKEPYKLKEEHRGILTPNSIWETDHLKGDFNRRNKVAFIIDRLNNILYDVALRVYNEVIVPEHLNLELQPIPYKMGKRELSITKERFIRYVNQATKRGVAYVNVNQNE